MNYQLLEDVFSRISRDGQDLANPIAEYKRYIEQAGHPRETARKEPFE